MAHASSAAAKAVTVAAQRAYVAVAASAAGVDGAGVPRSGREAFVALYRCYNRDQPGPLPAAAPVTRRTQQALLPDFYDCNEPAFTAAVAPLQPAAGRYPRCSRLCSPNKPRQAGAPAPCTRDRLLSQTIASWLHA